MDKTNISFESIFQHSLEGSKIQPSAKVLRNIKRKLFVTDFFSLNYRKLNIGYVSIFIIGLIVSNALIIKQNNTIVSLEKHNSDLNKTRVQKSSTIEETQVVVNKKNITENETKESKVEKSLLTASYVPDVTSGCAPLSIHFRNKSANAKKYSWNFGNGEKSNKESPEYTFDVPGFYKVNLTSTNSDGVEANYSQTIKVFSNPEANFKVDAINSDLNTKEIVFSNNSTPAKSYKWSFGDKTFSEEKEPKHVYEKFGVYKVSLVAISENGCVDSITKTNSFLAKDYRLVFPQVFKPDVIRANNGDYERPENKTFVFYPQNFGAKEYHLIVTASNGMEVFSTSDIKKGWDGYIRGRLAPAGNYTFKAYGVYPNDQEFSLSGNLKLLIDINYENYYNN